MAVESEGWLAAVKGAVRERRLDEGQPLFQQGDPVFGIFAVSEGRVRLIRHAPEGTPCVLHVAGQGNTFAEAALFSDVYHCEAVADLPSRVTVIPKDAMLAAFAADQAMAIAFMARLARQVQSLRTRLEIRNIRSAPERVRQYLLLLSRPGQPTITFSRPLKDAAAEIGLTHEAFYRALSALAADGVIERNGRQVTVIEERGRRGYRGEAPGYDPDHTRPRTGRAILVAEPGGGNRASSLARPADLHGDDAAAPGR